MPADVEQLVYVKEEGVPWHGMGTGTDGYTTSKQLLEEHELDWNVEKTPVQYTAAETEWLQQCTVPNRYVLYRDRDAQPLGIVGPNYQADAPKDIFGYADQLVPDGIARWATAGTLWNGGFPRFFATMKLEEDWTICNETHNQYLLFHTDYNGQFSLQILGTDVRVVCRNTVSLALGKENSASVRIRHNANDREGLIAKTLAQVNIISDKMRRFKDWAESHDATGQFYFRRDIIGDAKLGYISKHPEMERTMELFEPYQSFMGADVTPEQMREKQRKVQKARSTFVHNFWDPEVERHGDNLFSFYNAAIGYADYATTVKATGNNTRQEARNKSVLFGKGYHMKNMINNLLKVAN
jgi:phage/plasmid-like protein (TIGR03299 family)